MSSKSLKLTAPGILSGLSALNGLPLLLTFIFITVSAAHLEFRFLIDAQFELLLVLGLIGLFALPAAAHERDLRLAFWCSLLLCAPLFSSVANGENLLVLDHGEFRSWAKMLLVLPVMPWICRSVKSKERLIDSVVLGVVVFSALVLYKFHFLGQARVFDARPNVHAKNGDPNFICVILALAIPLILYKLYRAVRDRRKLAGFYYGGALILVATGVAITESRMGLLSILAGLCALFFRLPFTDPKLRRALSVAVVLFVVASISAGNIVERFRDIDDRSNEERLRTLQVGVAMTVEKPLFGYGWGTSPRYFFDLAGHGRLVSEEKALAVHNTFLQLTAELGVFGLIAYAGLFLLVWSEVRKAIRENRPVASFCLSSLIILLLNFMTLPLRGKDFALAFLGVIYVCVLKAPETEEGALA